VLNHLKFAVEDYQFRFSKRMEIEQIAAVLHIILYRNRFFPKYAYCTLSGFTDAGVPKIFSYDPVGSYEETKCRCNGSGAKMLQPLLDSWISRKNWRCEEGKDHKCTEEEVVRLARDVFNSAAETDVKTGDMLEMYVLKKDGFTVYEFPLRSD